MRRVGLFVLLTIVVLGGAAWVGVAARAGGSSYFTPGNLLVSRSVYGGDSGTVHIAMTLPPGCTSGCGTAIANGS